MTIDKEIEYHAGEMFALLGYHGTSMGNLAKACNKNKATLYHYFKSKDDLYEKVLFNFLNHLNVLLEENVSTKSTSSEKIRAFIETLVTIDMTTARILFRTFIDDTNTLPSAAVDLIKNRYKIFESIFKSGISKSEIKIIDPKNSYVTIIGSSITFILENSFNNQIKTSKDYENSKNSFIAELTNILLDRILLEEDIIL